VGVGAGAWRDVFPAADVALFCACVAGGPGGGYATQMPKRGDKATAKSKKSKRGSKDEAVPEGRMLHNKPAWVHMYESLAVYR